ncbi:hypothetical protein OIDMADRAFT_136340 [Oidiodendron maius Zn]|uniref:Xylanolytic transcriptional activator regulatory domain-containing protein n=1 Tax=Oidiodendron maius (strain Zn) TaxID=913774 RepID=A0A0C3CXN3_OIDMZ|nr:hypothetical protein OIDMADRAFT_136340 [Oidiodendron maius Zn]
MCGPDLGATIQQRIQKWYPAKATNAISLTPSLSPAQTPHAGQDAQLQSMIESTGQLDIDKGGYYNFRGVSSEKVFARVMDEQFKDLLGAGQIISSFHGTSSALDYDLLRSGTGPSPDFSYHNVTCLPSREVAKVLCYNALNRACSLLRFVHQTTFYETLDRIYKALAKGLSSEENRHLPLIYTVLALGCLFYSDPINGAIPIEHSTYERRVDQGAKYFRAARRMIDITDCRDIASLQAVVFMALFLHWSADLGACYSYIGIALRSALRMGLHRELCLDINPIERETRKRVFWAIRNMDVYVSAMLGLPVMLSTDEIDQPLPMEVDDECITEDAVISMPVGKTSLQVAANAHTRLVLILADVIKHVYPMNALQPDYGSTKSSYSISHTKIRGIERDLADWLDKLPLYLRPSGEGTPEVFCIQQQLRMSYSHVQMMLYRPFLHYVSERSCAGENIDNRSYAYAAACISVSRNIIHITTEMKRRDLLFGWISTCTTFFSIISLVYFVLENPDEDESQKILANANDGKDALTGFGRESMTADRCSTALNASSY